MSYQEQGRAGLGEGPVTTENATRNVWDTLAADGRFTRFLQAARGAQLENNFRGPERITVFAVPDDAIRSESDEALRGLVPMHVAHGYQTSADLRMVSGVRSLDGPSVTVGYEEGRIRFGDATVEHADIACTNGMIHVLNRLTRQCTYAG
jgi:transforming growth factor-beta-induced protein